MRRALLFGTGLAGLLLLSAAPSAAQRQPSSRTSSAAADYDEARWAHWEAQARVADGDYDGAVQAEQQAEAALRKVGRGDGAASENR